MTSENKINSLSKFWKLIYIVAILTIIANIALDITFSDRIDNSVIIRSIVLLIFSEYSRRKITSKKDN